MSVVDEKLEGAMHGWGGFRLLELLECERSSMPPATGHYKFADRLACSRNEFSLPNIFGEAFWIAGIANRNGRYGIPAFRNTECLPCLVMREACHLVDKQAARCGFSGQLSVCGTNVVYGHGIWRAIMAEVAAGNGNRQHRGVLGPIGIEFHQGSDHFLEIFGVIFGGHQIGPRLVVVAGRCPTGGFEKACENRGFYEFIGEGAWAPAIANQFMDRMISYGCFVHLLNPFLWRPCLMMPGREAVHRHRLRPGALCY